MRTVNTSKVSIYFYKLSLHFDEIGEHSILFDSEKHVRNGKETLKKIFSLRANITSYIKSVPLK